MSDISPQLIEQIKTAAAENTKLNIVAGGSKSFLGRKGQGQEINVCDHQGIINYHSEELVLTVRAGTSVAEINQALAEKNQWLSFEPPVFGQRGTMGGTLACNLSGPARPWSGSIRDMVLGVGLINGNGEHLRFGGQVIKNVAGYDASRLQSGAMGTLGIITEISLKVLPKPESSLSLVFQLDGHQALNTMNQIAGQPKPLSAACWLEDKLYLRLSGVRQAIEQTAIRWIKELPGAGQVLAQDEDQNDQFWQLLREQKLDFFATDKPMWRFSLPSNAPHFLPQANWLIDWGGSQRWLQGESLNSAAKHQWTLSALQELAIKANGQVGLFRNGDRGNEVFQNQPEALKKLHQRIKNAFDPHGIFNPCRLYIWL